MQTRRRLVQRGLKWPRIDEKERVAFFYQATFRHIYRQHITGDPRPQLNVLDRGQRTGEFGKGVIGRTKTSATGTRGGGAGVAEDGFSLQPATAKAPFIAAAIRIMVLAFII